MSTKTSMSICAALLLIVCAGCVPSDEELQTELAITRREAYLEWKRMRDSGQHRQAKVDGPLSVDDSVRLALQYNKQLQIAIQEREVTRGDRIADYNVILPSISARGTAARIEKGRGNTDIDDYSANITVTQPIFEGERIPATLRTARLLTALTDEQVRDQVQTLVANVASEYYDVLLAQHMVEVQREALVSAEAQYRMTSEKRRQETATDYDVLRAQVDVANYQAQMISAQNDIDTHRVNMLKLMGVSQDSNISFSDKLEFLPMRPVFERAVELASGNRPDLRIADIDARVAEEAIRISRSAFWPVVSGTFTTSWRDGWGGGRVAPNTTSRPDRFGRNPWEAGLTASYYFGIDNVGNLQAAKAQARQSHIEVLDRQEVMLQEIRLQMNNLANAEEQVKALVINQDAAREALRLVEVGYQAGVRTEVDVTDARKALTEVMGQYYSALNQHTKSRVNLQLAMGVLGPTCISDGPPGMPRVPIANIEEFAATDYVPPTPLPMPTSERAPERRTRTRERTTPEPRRQETPEARPDAQPESRTRTAPRSAQPIAAEQPVRSEPVTIAAAPAAFAAPQSLSLPVPPSAPARAPAPVAAAPAPAPVAVAPVAAPEPAPVQNRAQPMFKVTVREG